MAGEALVLSKVDRAQIATRFARYQRLTVRQKKRWIEILLAWEAKNRYDVFDEQGLPALRVEETGRGFGELLKRLFLGPLRPFSSIVSDQQSDEVLLQLRRPFRFIFHRLEIRSGTGELVGAIQRRWSWIRRIYTIEDASGQPIAQLFGPILKPWTFEVRVNERVIGTVRKRWSGLLKEMFTDADNFGIELGQIEDPTLKALAFAATVLVDVVHFERAKN